MAGKKIYIGADRSIDLVGLGNAIVDILVNVDDEFLKIHQLEKGSMNLINLEKSNSLLNNCEIIKSISGGSCANTVVSLAEMGNNVQFIGRTKNDYFGNIFSDDIKKSGALFETPMINIGDSSAHSIIFITPDAQRTMCSYLGASILFNSNDIDFNSIKNSNYLYLEGYLWDSDQSKEAFIKAAKLGKESNTKIILSLSDSFCVNRHRESFLELIRKYVDILFCNEGEILSLLGRIKFEECKKNLHSLCSLIVITFGENGSMIFNEGKIINIKPSQPSKIIDTTGAGDIYAGGFIHGLIHQYPLSLCGDLASLCAGQIISQYGARSEIDLKKIIDMNFN